MRDAQAIRFWTAFVALAALNIAGWAWMRTSMARDRDQPLVRLVRTGGAQELGGHGRLPLEFDRDLFEEASVGTTLLNPPFTMEPPTAGRWRIRARDEIAFEPEQPPRPGRIYRIQRRESHPIFTRFEIGGLDLPEIRYQPLNLLATSVTSIEPASDSSSPRRAVNIELHFNQDVAPEDLRNALLLENNAGSIEPAFQTPETADRHTIQVEASPGSHIDLTLSSELTGDDAVLGLDSSVHRRIEVPQALAPTQIYAQTRGFKSAEIYLYFNRRISSDQKTPPISIEPAVEGVAVSFRWNAIRLYGDFQPGQRYAIKVEPPLLGKDKTVLTEPFERKVTIPPRPAQLSFDREIGRLSSNGTLALDLQHVSVKSAEVSIYNLPERNIPLYLAGMDSSWDVARLGELIVSRTVVLDESDSRKSMHSVLQLEEFIQRKPGIYLVMIEDTEVRWCQDDAMVLVGDLSLHLQRDAKGMLAWTTSLTSGEPVPGARVVAWSRNRRELLETTTDENGLARLNIPSDDHAYLVTAAWDRDLAFVRPRDARTLDDRALGGSQWPKGLDVALYPDRGVHRPGEPVRLSGLLRTRDGTIPDALPLEIRLTRPDGHTVRKETVITSEEQGLFHLELPTRADAPTGNWKITCHLPGDEQPIAKKTCRIMPFVPVRIAVDTALEESPSEETDALSLRVDAQYLHGAPASGLQARTNVTFSPTRYTDKRFPDHQFENPQWSDPVRTSERSHLDEAGEARVTLDTPSNRGTWLTLIETSVMETGGRATTHRIWTRTDTAKEHLGAHTIGGSLQQPQTPIQIDAVLLDEKGELDDTTSIKAHLFTVSHQWTLHEARHEEFTWRSIEITRPVLGVNPSITQKPDGSRLVHIDGLARGAYRLQLDSEVSTSSVDFHVSDRSARGRMAADRPDKLELIPESDPKQPGETTSVLIRSPFPGLALITVETDRILGTQLAQITEDGIRVPIEIPDTVRDTCFVGATVIRPVDPTRTQWLPVRAQGAVRLDIDRTEHHLEPMIMASDAARPGESIHLTLSMDETQIPDPEQPRPVAHIWAVEEGALLTTDFHAPDPIDSFFKKRRRMVSSVDTVAELLPDYTRPSSMALIGGDQSGGYRSPIPVRMEQTAVLWQEHVPLDEDGVLEFELTMPQIDGAMRVMAVVVDGDRYGSTEHLIGVVAPLEITAVLPRAAAPGDTMSVPVRIQNRTNKEVEADVRLELGAGLEGNLDHNRVLLPAGGERALALDLTAGEPGAAEVRLDLVPLTNRLNTPARSFTRSIAIRPPHGRRHEIVRLRVPGESKCTIERDHSLEAFDGNVELFISDDPVIDINPVIESLIDYPYGCGEQTGSRTRGLLAAALLSDDLLVVSRPTLESMVYVGLDRLASLQQPEGGIGYWPGAERASAWISLQTALIAIEADKQEYILPEGFLEGLTRYTKRIARPDSRNPNPFYGALACRILAHTNEPDEPLMHTLASRRDELDLVTKAHLAEAFFILGLDSKADRLLEDLALPGVLTPTDDGRFNSDLSQVADLLDVLLRRRGEHPLIPELVDALANGRHDAGWRTTYESAAAVNALIRWHQVQPEEAPIAGTISIAGREIPFDSNSPGRFSFDTDLSADAIESVQTSGPGTAHLVVVTSGVPIQDQIEAPVSRGLSIKRRWLDATGTPIKPNTPLNSGDLVIVEVAVSARESTKIPNVAIVEVLPGGMEFELPTLATSASSNDVSLAEVDHVEFHDERLIAFMTATDKQKTIRYVLRAIVPGRWKVPRADALAMYDAAVYAHGASSEVEILSP